MASNPYSYSSAYPKDFQIVDGLGQLMPAWQYFFQALWDKLGGGSTTINNSYIVIDSPTGPVLSGSGPSSGGPVGGGEVQPKEPPTVQVLSLSPWTFTAGGNGLMTVTGGEVDYSRDGVTFYQASMVGGQFVVLKGDAIRVKWYGSAIPQAVWWLGGF